METGSHPKQPEAEERSGTASGARNGALPIAVDAMGGDNAPTAIVRGAVAAVAEQGCRVTLVGKRQQLIAELAAGGGRDDVVGGRIDVVDASQVVGMDEHPAAAVKGKRDASIVRTCELVAEHRAAGAVSAGNSGATLAAAVARIKRVPGIARPAIAVVVPSGSSGRTVVIDAGANTDCKPEWLAQFALMGSVYARELLGVGRPRVALISNGEEASKGNALVVAATPLLEAAPLDFRGNIEGRDLFRGGCDVAVGDGFTGNVVLKTGEGVAELLFTRMRAAASTGLRARVGGLLLKPRLRALRDDADYRRTGGALLLGVAGEVVIAHGRSDEVAIANAIRIAHQAATRQMSAVIMHASQEAASVTGAGASERGAASGLAPSASDDAADNAEVARA